MGQSFHDSLTNMKMFVVLALAAMAMAEPEADPQVLLNQHVTSINNVPVVQTPLVNTVVSNPTVYSTVAHSVAPSVYHANVYTPHVYLGKREAEAEPEADAFYGYYGYARPYAYGYRSYGYPYRYGYSYGKRSADAEPEADAYYYGAYGYGAYSPYPYGLYRPTYTTRWGGYGKRSADAEAEADPALVYNAVTPVHSVVSSPLVSAPPQLPPSRLSTPQSSAPSHTLLPTQSQLSPLSPLSTLLDPQSTTERERPRLIQLSSTPVSTLQSTLFTAPPSSTTPTQSPLSTPPPSPRPSYPLSLSPRPPTTVLSELMPDLSTLPTPESASTTLESRSHAKCAINLETDVQLK